MSTVYKFGWSSELSNEQILIINKINDDFVLKDGSNTLTGTLDMGVNKMSRVVDPSDVQDAATKNTLMTRLYRVYIIHNKN